MRLALLRASRRDPARFRIVQFSVQRDHVHLVVEAADKRALSSGLQGLAIRVARYVNDLLGRRGPLWADRWHGRALKTPREVRNALTYVLANFRKHGEPRGARRGTALYGAASRKRRVAAAWGIDPYSSGEWFDGWREWKPWSGAPPPFAEARRWRWLRTTSTHDEATARVTAEPETWLAGIGWQRYGLVGLAERPVTN